MTTIIETIDPIVPPKPDPKPGTGTQQTPGGQQAQVPPQVEPPFVPEFTVKASCFTQNTPENPVNGHITFIADDGNITLPGDSKVHSGTAIDATLAVHFIRNYFDHYRLYTVTPAHHQYQECLAKEDFPGMKSIADHAIKMHKKFFDLTYGMTLERDMLLKMLSQPKAEGIRFYLCGRMIDADIHLSLVAVGVDCEGNDLKYNPKDTSEPAVTELKEIAITTQSLAAEYLTPPPPNGITDYTEYFFSSKTEIDSRYALLKMAKQITGIAPVPAPATESTTATESIAEAKQ